MENTKEIYGFIGLLTAGINFLYIYAFNKMYELIGEGRFGTSIWLVFAGVVGCILSADLLNGVSNMEFEKLQIGLEKGYMKTYLLCAMQLEPEQCLWKDILDCQQNAKNALEGVIFYYVRLSALLFQYIPYFVCVMIFLLRMDIRVAGVMLVTFLPGIFAWRLRKSINYDVSVKVGEKRRQMEAFEAYNTTLPALYETRFFHMHDRFIKKFRRSIGEYQGIWQGYYRRMFGIELMIDFLHLAGIGVILGFILFMVRQNAMNGAQIATLLTVLLSIYDSMGTMMNECVGTIFENSAKISVLMDFKNMIREYAEKEVPEFSAIGLEHVSYRYPDAEKDAISDISLDLKRGEVIAIVGENGSGKTTLSRVLGGLLPAKEGELLTDVHIVSNDEMKAYRKHVSAVFQDFQKYALTLRENICFSETENAKEFEELISMVQLTEKNPDVVLSKEFGGEEYSGGQWQRVAIARGQYKKSELLIFDEPTSAIDPLEEVRIMQMLVNLCKNKMAVLVTHRIGAATMADRIAVMKEGRMVECGSHAELLAKKGEYYRLYEAQKQWYE
ncbi:ATP-binding cassette, subfamily B [Lachnospiraceae bacterium XBB1006]|nr:ATP-binding cassette, subfamily B [Lachnospiraceae bacterium XBB1006]